MTWLGSLSAQKVIAFALLWPASLATLLLVARQGIIWWFTHGDRGRGVNIGLHVAPAGWLLLGVVMLAPPLFFLALWALARR